MFLVLETCNARRENFERSNFIDRFYLHPLGTCTLHVSCQQFILGERVLSLNENEETPW